MEELDAPTGITAQTVFDDITRGNTESNVQCGDETGSAITDGTILQDEHCDTNSVPLNQDENEAASFVSEPDTVNDSGFADNEAAPMDEDLMNQ